MHPADDMMLLRVDKGDFFLRETPPEQKNDAGFLLTQRRNHCISEFFPAETPVTSRFVGVYRENGVEQQHSVGCPAAQ